MRVREKLRQGKTLEVMFTSQARQSILPVGFSQNFMYARMTYLNIENTSIAYQAGFLYFGFLSRRFRN